MEKLLISRGKFWNGAERRSGADRRQREGKSPTGVERRRLVEPRQIEVVELFPSDAEWEAMKRRWFH